MAWCYVRSCDVDELTDDLLDTMVEQGGRNTSPVSSVALCQVGGAVARVDDDETAFNDRTAGFTFTINGNTETADGFDGQREWARGYWAALAPWHSTVYVNVLREEGRSGSAGLRPGEVRPAPGAQARLRPRHRRPLNRNIRPG